MKKRYFVLWLSLLILIASASAITLTYQQPEDFSTHVGCSGTCTWFENESGGNSYMDLSIVPGSCVFDPTPMPMSYAAETVQEAWSGIGIIAFDSGWDRVNVADEHNLHSPAIYYSGSIYPNDRVEFKMSGSTACAYVNGNVGDCAELAQYPSYVCFGGTVDDTVWGDTESKYIFGMPDQGYWTGKQYFLMKDIMYPARSGFYRVNTTDSSNPTLIYSFSMPTTFGKGSSTNETVTLSSTGGGGHLDYYTGTKYAGVIEWNLTELFDTVNYGLVSTTIHNQIPNTDPFVTSDFVPYIGSGASINFDKNAYATGETAILTVVMSDEYYDLDTYSYHVTIMDVYGTEISDQPISFSASPHTGTVDYVWEDDDSEGVYYGLLYARQLSDDKEILMTYDTAELSSKLVIDGYVFGAETEAIIVNATVNVTQGAVTDSDLTGSDGFYTSTSNFVSNEITTIFASASGYENYTHSFEPLRAGEIQINLTLVPLNPTYSGIALGGVARTPPYNRTINAVRVDIVNASDGHSYVATTNSVGYYVQNDMAGASHWFDVWGSKTGFWNSTIYRKLVVGS